MTINGRTFEIKKITGYSKEIMKLTGNLKELQKTTDKIDMSKIEKTEIKQPKFKITGYSTGKYESPVPSDNSFNLWETLRKKIEQIKPAIQQFKQTLRGTGTNSKELELVKYKISEIEEKLENAKNGKIHLNTKEIIEAEAQLERLNNKKEKLERESKGNFFSGFFSSLKKVTSSMDGISGITIKIKNQIKQWGSGFKGGLGHVLKYAGALFSLQGIYSTLSSCANAWLSSQNAGAKQLSANIDYMKYAMGSALAPVIQFVTNLVYQLMKAIQSVAYALTGVNIFAKASANSYANMAGSAKKAKNETKQLAGIHSEISNVKSNDNSNGSGNGGSTTPNFDLSGIDNTPNSIIDAIKNGNWYEVGAAIGEKLNEAMNNIPWTKIQNTAKNIGSNIAKFLNGFIAKTDWNNVGNTFAQGLNTVIYFGQSFVNSFDFSELGKSIGITISSTIRNIDWKALGDTLSSGIKGIFNTMSGFFENFDWTVIVDGLFDFINNFDWNEVSDAIFLALGSACASLVNLGMVIGLKINEALEWSKEWWKNKIEECGGNIVLGILKGITDQFVTIGQWINEHIFRPFIDGFKNVFGIHSPSTVMAEMGKYLVEGLKQGLSDLWNKIKSPFVELDNSLSAKFNLIKGNINNWANNTKETIANWGNNVKSKISECWSNVSNTVNIKANDLKNNILFNLNSAKEIVSNWCSNIKSKISSAWSNASQNVWDSTNNLKYNISVGLNNAKGIITNWETNVKNIFSNLGKNASIWGKDLTDNMASGIRNNIGKITSAVNSVANKIKSYLHFTEPDVGPLSNFHTYMPDMINLMVNGIKSNTNKLESEVENLASMMSYTINTDSITGFNTTQPQISPINVQTSSFSNRLEDVLSDFASINDNDRPINLTINIGNKKIGEILLDDLRDKTRRTGKDIEALIGG